MGDEDFIDTGDSDDRYHDEVGKIAMAIILKSESTDYGATKLLAQAAHNIADDMLAERVNRKEARHAAQRSAT